MSEPRYALDHVGVEVTDFAASRAFYERALEPLGIGVVMEWGETMAGFGVPGRPSFWIRRAGEAPVSGPLHVAFHAADRARVDAFHEAALAAGGRDNGPPGPREYHPSYYGAFVLDPDGNNVEAVCHMPPEA
jgi:catechol 2,3-dioxygenase-like lactoylglutathione lyase family enzyme